MNRNTDIPAEELEIIERYILKQMPDDEYDTFTLRLQNDANLQNKVRSVRFLFIGVQEATLNDKIEEFHKGFFLLKKNEDKPGNKVIAMKRWLVAASVIVVVGVGTLLFFNHSNKGNKLFAKYYKPDPGLITAMSSSDNYLFDHAMIDYKTKKYDSAISTWEKLLAINPGNDTLNYFIGSAFLAKDKNDSAISYFQKVITEANSYFIDDAYWYIGLALLEEKRTEEAISYLEKTRHQNKEALLSKLKKS